MNIKDDWDNLCDEMREEAVRCTRECPEERQRFERELNEFCDHDVPEEVNRLLELQNMKTTILSGWYNITHSIRMNKRAEGKMRKRR